MKKLLALLLAVGMVVSLAACTSSSSSDGTDSGGTDTNNTIYVLGPTPDHGWTAQAGSYAEAKCEEITNEGTYKAVYMSASSGEEQVDQVNTIIANGDAVGVVFFALEDSAQAGQEALYQAGIPFISFDRIIEATQQYAILNNSGDNWQCGAAIGYWLQENGMVPGDVMVTLIGDNGTVCSRRQDGFEQFLRGELDYNDKATGQTYHTSQVWTQEEIDALTADYKYVCNWSADGAYGYLEQKLDEIVSAAKNTDGRLYVFSMDDEMTLGFLNLLEGNAVSDATKADLEGLDVYVSAIGGMAEMYAVIDGSSDQAPIAQTYFDGIMSVYFSPQMIDGAIDHMLDYLAGDWDYEQGAGLYEPVWIVDATNVSQYQGFQGH